MEVEPYVSFPEHKKVNKRGSLKNGYLIRVDPPPPLWSGMPDTSKTDEFSEKFRRGGGVIFRAVESESLKKSKSRKKSDKVGKVGFDFLLDFWQKKVPH